MKKFEETLSPKDMGFGDGWCADLNRAYTNGDYAVLVRTVNTPWGKVRHAAIRSAANADIPWAEKQEIKNAIFGPEKLAVEVFPKETELVDAANMYHLWILPAEFQLPFNLFDGRGEG